MCSLPTELLLFRVGRRSVRLRLNSAEAAAEALLGLAELGKKEIQTEFVRCRVPAELKS